MNTTVTGYQLREAIKQLEIQEATLQGVFQESLRAFPNTRIENLPADVAKELETVTTNIAVLQEAQARYNLMVRLPSGETLCYAVKVIGSLGRLENLWKRVAVPKKEPSWGTPKNDGVRSKDQEYAFPTVSPEEASRKAREALKRVSALRAGIAIANATAISLEDLNLNPSLLA